MKRRDFIAGSGALVAGIAATGAGKAFEKREKGDFPRIDHAANEKIRVAFAGGTPLFAPVDRAISDGEREKAVSEPDDDFFARRSDLDS